jgi:thioredoxin reductase (NADPH)
MMPSSNAEMDALVIGGGPAGLLAAVYLARFTRRVQVLDAGNARADLIPLSHNCPGFPEGIAGRDLLARLRRQAEKYGVPILERTVVSVEKRGDMFEARTGDSVHRARNLVLATGTMDLAPAVSGLDEAVAAGIIRLCPVCDGYEVIGKCVGVIGPEQRALPEARYLLSFTRDIVLLGNDPADYSGDTRAEAKAAGIDILDTVEELIPKQAAAPIVLRDGRSVRFDAIYVAMGCEVRSGLAASLGAARDEEGFLLVNEHNETSVKGVYAIGDVVKGLNQLSVAFGHAALAASHIHNTLA